MEVHPIYAVIALGLPVLLLNLWGLRLTYRELRRIIPGTWAEGTPERPRLYAEGTPQTVGAPLHAPLSGRRCAAWRISVKCHRELTYAVMRRYDRYSEGDFILQCDQRSVSVHLLPGEDSTLPVQIFPNYAPPWVMPREQPPVEFSVRVLGEHAVVPASHGLSKIQARHAEEAALAEIARLNLNLKGESIAEIQVTETLVDTSRRWACEGPCSTAKGDPAISAVPGSLESLSTPSPVKLSPTECLARSRQQTIRHGVVPVVVIDILLISLVAVATILART